METRTWYLDAKGARACLPVPACPNERETQPDFQKGTTDLHMTREMARQLLKDCIARDTPWSLIGLLVHVCFCALLPSLTLHEALQSIPVLDSCETAHHSSRSTMQPIHPSRPLNTDLRMPVAPSVTEPGNLGVRRPPRRAS